MKVGAMVSFTTTVWRRGGVQSRGVAPASMTVNTPAPAPPPVLLLTAGDGPWAWRRTRYMLLDGALDAATTTYPLSAIRKLRALGSVMRTQDGSHVTFEFDEAPPLRLELGVTYEEAGVGASLWDASIAMALFQRSGDVPLPRDAHVMELGAGIGLPSLDLARWPNGGVARITLTDAREKLLELAEQNAGALRQSQPVPAEVATARLQWGGAASDDDATGAAPRAYDVVLASDVCYEEDSVPPLASLLEELAAPLTLLIGPAGRPSYNRLRERLADSPRLELEERMLTLVCANADEVSDEWPLLERTDATGEATVRSSGVHRLLILSPTKQGDAPGI